MIAAAATSVSMSWLGVVDVIVCALILLRIVFFKRAGATHRPIAALLAYIIALAAGGEALMLVLWLVPPPAPGSVVMHAVLLLALVANRGNVLHLFRTPEAENSIYRFFRRQRDAQG